jgi:diaminopimelate epimerase
MDFHKMHGLGNDFVLIDRLQHRQDLPASFWAPLAVQMCDRHFGIGADGILIALPSTKADLQMRIFNADGSEAEMCGNGIRCLARYARDRGIGGDPLRVDTGAGLLTLTFPGASNEVRVDMGPPHFAPAEIPILASGERVVDFPLEVGGRRIDVTAVSMGNPHAVAFLDEAEWRDLPLAEIGPAVEHHPAFPQRTNFHAVLVRAPHRATVRVWERGAGPTLACGTGACAVAVAGAVRGVLTSPVDVELPGGTLRIEWTPGSPVYMTGPAEYVFEGRWLGD